MFRSILSQRSRSASMSASTVRCYNVHEDHTVLSVSDIDKSIQMDPHLCEYLGKYGRKERLEVTRLRDDSLQTMKSRAINLLEPTTCAFLSWQLRQLKATRILEIGTFTGCTSLAMALDVKDHCVHNSIPIAPVTTSAQSSISPVKSSFPPNISVSDLPITGPLVLTMDCFLPVVSDVALPAWTQAQVLNQPLIFLEGHAPQLLSGLVDRLAGTFDAVFIDADKSMYDVYYEAALTLLSPTGVVFLDNVLWKGHVSSTHDCEVDLSVDVDRDTRRQRTKVMKLHQLNEKIHADYRVDSMLLPIGDGLIMARKI